jgi:Putative Ig domain
MMLARASSTSLRLMAASADRVGFAVTTRPMSSLKCWPRRLFVRAQTFLRQDAMRFLCIAVTAAGLCFATTSPAHAIYVITSPVVDATVDVPYTYPAASSPNGTWTLVNGPTGMTIDAATGVVEWTPTADQIGLQQVTIQVTDAAGNTAYQPYTIQVRVGNPPPPKKGP